jgi:membrane-associated phospholipid phosphatase
VFAPRDVRAIHITYTRLEQPLATYEFQSVPALTDYLLGASKRPAFLQTVLVRYATPGDRLNQHDAVAAGLDDEPAVGVYRGRDGEAIQVSSEDREDNRFKLSPKMSFFFNDPSGALRYELTAAANYDRRLGSGLYLNGAMRLGVVENISDVTQPSNSALPHVRSDIAEYKRGSRFKLNRLMLSQYLNPAEHVYARVSGGLYEEMFRGFGGQILYLPNDQRWAVDMNVDALQQRGYKGWFDGRDYRTVMALGSLHYRLPQGMTITARAGQFLAKDRGVRLEFKRRFRSGVEVGAWYAKTNGNDITSPGTPTSPYHDKGVFLSIPLASMLPMDSQANAGFAISPWTRDVGQMVLSPGDLYDIMEQPRRDLHSFDGLGNFAERPDEANLPAVTRPDAPLVNPWPAFRMRLEQSQQSAPPVSDWVRGTALAGGAVLASALLDKPVDRYAEKHKDARFAKTWGNFGKNMPIALIATSGIAATMGDDRMQNMGIISLQSVAASLGVSVIGKYAVGRARPEEGRGPWAQVGDGYRRSDASFPSGHSAAAFAAVTPFAQEYDAPWLYSVAAVSSLGRVAGRKHWVSDTVAGGIIGYTIGTLLWKGQRDIHGDKGSSLSIVPVDRGLSVAWQGKY